MKTTMKKAIGYGLIVILVAAVVMAIWSPWSSTANGETPDKDSTPSATNGTDTPAPPLSDSLTEKDAVEIAAAEKLLMGQLAKEEATWESRMRLQNAQNQFNFRRDMTEVASTDPFHKRTGPVLLTGSGWNTNDHPVAWWPHPSDPRVALPAVRESVIAIAEQGGNGIPAMVIDILEEGEKTAPPFTLVGLPEYTWKKVEGDLMIPELAASCEHAVATKKKLNVEKGTLKKLVGYELWCIVRKDGAPIPQTFYTGAPIPVPAQASANTN